MSIISIRFSRMAYTFVLSFGLAFLSACSPSSSTDVAVADAWARATKPGQEVGAAYMNLTSPINATLLKAESDVAGSMEIHSMTMEGDVMKMRMLETLDLPKGKTVTLAPGDFHLMLFDLKKPLTVGETLNVTLHFTSKDRGNWEQKIALPIKEGEDE